MLKKVILINSTEPPPTLEMIKTQHEDMTNEEDKKFQECVRVKGREKRERERERDETGKTGYIH